MLIQNDLYPTRGDQERLIERKDPILYGWDHPNKCLSESQLTNFEQRGFVLVPNAFSPAEVALLKAEVQRVKRQAGAGRNEIWRDAVPAGERESLLAPERASRLLRGLACERRILDGVMQIVGGPVCLHRARVHIEDGSHGTAYPWHSEFETWHAEDGIPRMRGVEAWVLLERSEAEGGALCMLSKSHHIYAACVANGDGAPRGAAGKREVPRPSFEALLRLRRFGGLAWAQGEAGTLVLCDSNLMYGSSPGPKGRARSTVMFSYNSLENLPAERPFASREFRPAPIVSMPFARLKGEFFDALVASEGSQRIKPAARARVSA
ncbi:MAG TPA: phytanoyl-CoA dioxygenase family protein [Gammaproteobacteria bacterium]|nr:phytanoyl-CoA dioxygenase family protein [Gammaproteobacteria bacterium]